MNIDEIVDKIAWWIPFRKKRDFLRNELKETINKIIKDKDKIIYDKNRVIEDKNKTIENNKKIINTLPYIVLNRTVELFSFEKDLNKQKEILEKNLYLIEIEIASYCNRTCSFCPNSIIDRHSSNIELEEELYLKIINNLKEINYSNKISFHRFNEPLANRELIIKRVKQAREVLPNADLQIFTNGDYLTRDYLNELRLAGINTIIMSYYSKEDNQFDLDNIIKPSMEKIAKKLGLEYNIVVDNKKEYTIKFDYNDLYFIYKARNFKEIGTDRGGSINNSYIKKIDIRKSGCYYPLTDLYIDYNGLVMPCCNTRSDLEIHKPYILGDIHYNNLFEIFTSEKIVNIRKYLYSDTAKDGPCKHCFFSGSDRLQMLTSRK